jgi:hypothetical protein
VTVAVDSTGFSTSTAPGRCAETASAADARTKAVLACGVASSRTADVKRLQPVMEEVQRTGIGVSTVVAGKGCGAEHAHAGALEAPGQDAEARMPARKHEAKPLRAASKPGPKGLRRNRTWRGIDEAAYAMRAVAETVNAMLKRKTGEAECGKGRGAAAEGMKLTAIAHNIVILFEDMRVII